MGSKGMNTIRSMRSEKVEVRRSGMAGRGCHAIAPIAEGEVVAIKAGHIVGPDMERRLRKEVGDYALQIEENYYLMPRTADEIEETAVFMNHSCDPNVGFSGQVVYVAMRDIAPGEELCHDYAMMRGDDYELSPCLCGSAQCRGTVTGHDWRLPDLQQRYGDHFMAYLLKRIRGQAPHDESD